MTQRTEIQKEAKKKNFLSRLFSTFVDIMNADRVSTMSVEGEKFFLEKPEEFRKAFYKHAGVEGYENIETEITLE